MTLEDALDGLRSDRHDRASWDTIYRALWPFVFAASQRACATTTFDPEDIAQDVFLRAVRLANFRNLMNVGDLRAYLTVVVHHTVAAKLRGLRGHRGNAGPLEDHAADPGLSAPSLAEAHLLRSEIGRRLRDADARLYEMLLEARSVDEIAFAFGISYSAAAVRIHRLRGQIRNMLEL